MKDFYSFHADENDADNYYEKMKGITKIFSTNAESAKKLI